MTKPTSEPAADKSVPSGDLSLLSEIRQSIEAAPEQSVQAVNSTRVVMYWQIGRWIREDVVQNERTEYGKEILATLSQ